MTYLGFHGWFNIPLLAALLAWNAGYPLIPGELAAVAIVLAVVMVFTSPWDNAAARAGIWGFPRDKYSVALGWLPVEEYLFFVLQSLNIMALCRGLVRMAGGFRTGMEMGFSTPTLAVAGVVAVLWAAGGAWLWCRRPARRWHYAVHLFFWFGPVLLLQWIVAAPLLAAQGMLLAGVTLGLGTYYVLADIVAVRHGVWHFDDSQTEGRKIVGILPWEEAAFFYLTSLLVAQSYLLFLPGAAR